MTNLIKLNDFNFQEENYIEGQILIEHGLNLFIYFFVTYLMTEYIDAGLYSECTRFESL